ncbi:MAG: inositol monophosphatase [Chloroflexi bacterium]|nr:inositol monophosphatase [Chloroflexota bacterium]
MTDKQPSAEALSALLEAASQAAVLGGDELCRLFRQTHQIRHKGLRDLVTEADVASEQLVLQHLQRLFPRDAFLSEESFHDVPLPDQGICWVVDPLDGTTNYAHGVPVFSVSVAALQDGVPLVGVVYEPLRRWLFAAQRGGGAALNGAPLRASGTPHLAGAVVGFDWGRQPQERMDIVEYLGRISPLAGTLRNMGSAALGLAYVAAGWLDLYLHLSLNLWDSAAGVLLVLEAGGQVSHRDGVPWGPVQRSCLATNGLLHRDVLRCLAS